MERSATSSIKALGYGTVAFAIALAGLMLIYAWMF